MTNINLSNNFTGSGYALPFEFNSKGGVDFLKSDTPETQLARIKQAIFVLLGTKKGERFFNRDFGCRLPELVFEPNDNILVGLARQFVINAINLNEKRVRIKDVDPFIDIDNNILFIPISYTIIATNVEGNLVYPFFLARPV